MQKLSPMKLLHLFLLWLVIAPISLLAQRQAMPNVAIRTLEGRTVHIADYKGKVVYIDFWASWCQPCLASMPSLVSLSQRMYGKDVVILTINRDKKKRVWKKFAKERQVAGIVGWTKFNDADVAALNVLQLPRYILVDKQGNIAIAEAKGPAQADAQIETLLAE